MPSLVSTLMSIAFTSSVMPSSVLTLVVIHASVTGCSESVFDSLLSGVAVACCALANEAAPKESTEASIRVARFVRVFMGSAPPVDGAPTGSAGGPVTTWNARWQCAPDHAMNNVFFTRHVFSEIRRKRIASPNPARPLVQDRRAHLPAMACRNRPRPFVEPDEAAANASRRNRPEG